MSDWFVFWTVIGFVISLIILITVVNKLCEVRRKPEPKQKRKEITFPDCNCAFFIRSWLYGDSNFLPSLFSGIPQIKDTTVISGELFNFFNGSVPLERCCYIVDKIVDAVRISDNYSEFKAVMNLYAANNFKELLGA